MPLQKYYKISSSSSIHQPIHPYTNQSRTNPQDTALPRAQPKSRPALQNLQFPLSKLFHAGCVRVDAEACECYRACVDIVS